MTVTLMWTRAQEPSLLPSLLMQSRNQTITSQSKLQMEAPLYLLRYVNPCCLIRQGKDERAFGVQAPRATATVGSTLLRFSNQKLLG